MTLGPLRFTNVLGGTADWIYPGPAIDLQSPASAQAVNGTTYLIYAEAFDRSQWEIATGAYNSGTGTFVRTAVLFNSLGTNAKINFGKPPQIAVYEIPSLGNLGGVSYAVVQTLTAGQKAQAQGNIFIGPTTQVFLSGSGTYTPPSQCLWIKVRGKGAGGGGAGSGTTPGTPGTGGDTTFSTLTAHGGSPGNGAGGGTGGTATGGSIINFTGAAGGLGSGLTNQWGGKGGGDKGGNPGQPNMSAGGAAATNSGCGGGGAGDGATINSGGGGGEGGYFEGIITSPTAVSYAVGALGTGSTLGTGGSAGGNGAAGWLIVEEYYGS